MALATSMPVSSAARRTPGDVAPLVLAIEIGGTMMRIAASRGGAPDVVRVATPNYLDLPFAAATDLLAELLERVATAARGLGANAPDLVVVAWPGPILAGDALRSPTILGPLRDRRFDVRGAFEAWFPHARVHVMNDLTAAGYYFVGLGFTDFCVVTIGSGIGNKVFLGGEPQLGPHCHGGEIGHLKLTPQPGSPVAARVAEIGSMASGRGTLWLEQAWDGAAARQSAVPAECSAEFVTAFLAGETRAVAVVRAGAWPLAVALGALHLGIGLAQFVIIGGFAKALGERYRMLLAQLCRELTWDVGQDWDAMIIAGPSGVDEGLAGALHFGQRRAGAVLAC
jgi:C7-cyclitol 7-kinase